MRNAQHGLAKIRKEEPGKAINLEKALQEILNGLDAARGGFPAALRLEEQGMFILGYYQQRQAFFTKKETAESATRRARSAKGGLSHGRHQQPLRFCLPV